MGQGPSKPTVMIGGQPVKVESASTNELLGRIIELLEEISETLSDN